MASGVDMSDKNAWDDSMLINSWDDAVAEYKKYHGIHQSGKRLEDVLTEEELKELREDYGEIMEEAEVDQGVTEASVDADQQGIDLPPVELNGIPRLDEAETRQQDITTSEQQQQGQPDKAEISNVQAGPLTTSMPQAILGTVQDENLKNIMMSWYYAGYYTGLHAGQQQASQNAPPKQ